MSADYFLKIDGIDGESTDSKHTNEIEVDSYTWTEQQSTSGARGNGVGAGKVAMGNFTFNTRTNKSSPKLLLACATGSHIKSAILTCRKAGAGQQEFYKLTLTDVVVASYTTGADVSTGSDRPLDTVQLAFAKIQCEYRAQKQDGSLDNPITSGYDLSTNTAV